jgi:hypothetical protein
MIGLGADAVVAELAAESDGHPAEGRRSPGPAARADYRVQQWHRRSVAGQRIQRWCLGSAFLFADVDRGEATSNEQQRLVGT